MNYRAVASTLLLLSLLPALGCDKATPVAPDNSVLLVSANPAKVGLNGQSTITVVGRKPDGQPLNPGTEVRLSVDKGTISPAVIVVDDGGQGTATFRADGRSGIAKVTALTGGGMTMATTDVQVGESAETKPTVLISVNPGTIPVGGTATVTIIGRNSDGSRASGQQVILTTSLGTLSNARPRTGNDGTASVTLTAGNQSGTARLSAVMGSSDVATVDVEIRDATITLDANPSSVLETGGTIELNAFVRNFQGGAIANVTVRFQAQRGQLSQTSKPTDSTGAATVTLTLTEANLNGITTFQVTALTASSSGEDLSATVTITVTDVPGN